MVGHDNESAQIVESGFPAAFKFVDHRLSHFRKPQEHRPMASGIQIAVHPKEGFSGRSFARRRIQSFWQTPLQVPGDEQPAALGVDMRQTSARHSTNQVLRRTGFSLDIVWRTLQRAAMGFSPWPGPSKLKLAPAR